MAFPPVIEAKRNMSWKKPDRDGRALMHLPHSSGTALSYLRYQKANYRAKYQYFEL